MDWLSLTLLLRIPLCVILLIRAVYLALRDPEKRASELTAKLLLATGTPRFYWKRDAACAAVFILTTLPNIIDADLAYQILKPAPDWFQVLFYVGYFVLIVCLIIYLICFDYLYRMKQKDEEA